VEISPGSKSQDKGDEGDEDAKSQDKGDEDAKTTGGSIDCACRPQKDRGRKKNPLSFQ
jgi:hypothetical protein